MYILYNFLTFNSNNNFQFVVNSCLWEWFSELSVYFQLRVLLDPNRGYLLLQVTMYLLILNQNFIYKLFWWNMNTIFNLRQFISQLVVWIVSNTPDPEVHLDLMNVFGWILRRNYDLIHMCFNVIISLIIIRFENPKVLICSGWCKS